ncbi:hypothetical protein C8J56DRAFT_959236 [Mycena floridula]|nr:hypothetical protein C8J56DRAFT_959236 [Mycena floridula]
MTSGDVLGLPLVGSPGNSDPESDGSDSSGSSEATIDIDAYPRLGFHPLERMNPLASDAFDFSGGLRPPNDRRNSLSGSESSASTSSSFVYDIDYETVIDDLLTENPDIIQLQTLIVIKHSSSAEESIMVKCLSRNSPELFILLELNHRELRQDPWNPVPHILCAVEREDHVFLCMQQLAEINRPPFKNYGNYIDFFRQILEGLTFLHELQIGQISFREPLTNFMIDIGPQNSASQFDRTRFPVKYYYVNLANAVKFTCENSVFQQALAEDVQECGSMIDCLLLNVPLIGPKFKGLVHSMSTGGFTADAARKLLEALCKSLESSIFDRPALSPGLETEGEARFEFKRAQIMHSITRSQSHPIPSFKNMSLLEVGSTATLVPPQNELVRTLSNPAGKGSRLVQEE